MCSVRNGNTDSIHLLKLEDRVSISGMEQLITWHFNFYKSNVNVNLTVQLTRLNARKTHLNTFTLWKGNTNNVHLLRLSGMVYLSHDISIIFFCVTIL